MPTWNRRIPVARARDVDDVNEEDEVFRALADPNRRGLLDSLNTKTGQNLRELCQGRDMTRQSVSKHLGILEAANLVTTVRHGREKLHYLNPVPINEIAERWINHYDQDRISILADLKTALEDTTEAKPDFVYTTYIKTTPDRLWPALTDPAFTERWWQTIFISDWNVGSTMAWQTGGVTVTDPEQVVLEYEPSRRLSYTWHSFTPELGEHHGFSAELLAAFSGEPRSQVTFELEPVGAMVKLTVIHGRFEPGSAILAMVSQGWPQLLASLKTFLETGKPLFVPSEVEEASA